MAGRRSCMPSGGGGAPGGSMPGGIEVRAGTHCAAGASREARCAVGVMVRGTVCTFDTNTTAFLTRRGEPVDQATSVVTGASCGYLLCQFFTIAYYWREKAFKSKQPHVLLRQFRRPRSDRMVRHDDSRHLSRRRLRHRPLLSINQERLCQQCNANA